MPTTNTGDVGVKFAIISFIQLYLSPSRLLIVINRGTYKDIIIFRGSDTPLVWDISFTFTKGTLYFGKNNQIEMKDPEDIGKELSSYLSSRPRVPSGIDELGSNNIVEWLNKV